MGKIKILNSTFEYALRFLTIIRVCKLPLSAKRLAIYSYLCIYLSDIFESAKDIHPLLPYRANLFLAINEVVYPAIQLFVKKGLINCIYKESGIFYTISDSGRLFVDMIEGDYKKDLCKAISKIDKKYQNYSDEILIYEISQKIEMWGSEFQDENLLSKDEYDQ